MSVALSMDDGAHDSNCVLYCAGTLCEEFHACWCADGNLSAAEFGIRHPLWLKLPYLQWLDTDDGTIWLHAMELTR